MSWAIWITGLPVNGRSALARKAAARLRTSSEPVTVLELDQLRQLLAPARGCPRGEEVVHRAIAHVAAVLVEAGVPVIVDATDYQKTWTDRAREIIPRFAELDTTALDSAQAANEIIGLAQRLRAGSSVRRASTVHGCVIWITGRPGSGKTTLARGVADALGDAGVAPMVLEPAGLRSALVQDRLATEADEEVVHRTLACMAKHLAEAGVAVIVDATTPRRSWRELARREIPSFAEVQLVCPADLCAERERATRWHLGAFPLVGSAAAAPTVLAAPEICVEYEESPAPELTLHTHVQGHWSAVQQTLRLARHLLSRDSAGHLTAERRPSC